MSGTRTIKKRTQAKKEKSFFVSVFLGTLISLLVGVLLLIASCFVGLSMADPDKLTPALSLASLFFTALLGGYISARSHLKNGLACGALSGIFLIGILILLVFAFGFSIRLSLFAICAPAVVVCAAIAGICGVSTTSAKKPKHKKKF